MDSSEENVKPRELLVNEATLQLLKSSGLISQKDCMNLQSVSALYDHLKETDALLSEQLSKFDSNQNLKEHLEELHKYNTVKDATQSLLGSISVQTGVSVTELHEQFDNEEDDDTTIRISQANLKKAIALIGGDEPNKAQEFGGMKTLRECQSASLRALGLQSAADMFLPDSITTDILEMLRTSLLENNSSATAKLLEWLVLSGNKTHLPNIWKTAAVLFLSHKSNSQGCFDEFVEMCADQRLPEEKRRLVEKLITLPDFFEHGSKKLPKKNSTAGIESPTPDHEDDPDNDL